MRNPFHFFNERDAKTAFALALKEAKPSLFEATVEKNGLSFSRYHEEYPIPPFIGNSRGKYDVVILNEAYLLLKTNKPYFLSRPSETRRTFCPPKMEPRPFMTVIEFKFLYEDVGRVRQIQDDFEKLKQAKRYSDFVYFIYMQRLLKGDKQWASQLERLRHLAEQYAISTFYARYSQAEGKTIIDRIVV